MRLKNRVPHPILFDETTFERAAFGEISFEVRGIDLDATNYAGHSELQDCPIVPRDSSAARFPTIAHILAASRHQEIERLAVELIARGDDAPSTLNRREINLHIHIPKQFGLGHNFSIHSKPCHSSVRVNF